MITYEKAQELKEAGFPQEYKKTDPLMDWAYDTTGELHLLHSDNDTGWWIGNDYNHQLSEMTDEQMQKDWVKCPTLSELIEACGGLYFNLERNVDDWQALTNNGKELIAIGRGSTPEEAVSNLYLELNKKTTL